MSGSGKVTLWGRVQEMDSTREVIQLWTDSPDKDSAVYIEVQDPHPKIGDHVEWTTARVLWNGRSLRKLGYAFDPNAPLH